MKKVFVINGIAGVGKDTFILLCRELLKGKFNVATYSSVDEVKQYLKDNENWDGITKDAYWRIRMYEVKKQMIEDNNRPTRYLVESANNTPDNSLIFFHIRELDEIQKLLKLYPEAKTIHIVRNNIEIIDTPVDAKPIELEYDFTIDNSGSLDDYMDAAREFVIRQLENLIETEEQSLNI